MFKLVKKTTVLVLILGLLVGFFVGMRVDDIAERAVVENQDNESSGPSTYDIMGFQLGERVKAYYGLVDSVEQSAGIGENENPENISRRIRSWLGDKAVCRHYATLTFTVLAERGYENLALHTGYIELDNQKRGHVWLTWENESLEYPIEYRLLKHVSENKFTKKQLWKI